MKLEFAARRARAEPRSAAPVIRLPVEVRAPGTKIEALVLRARVQIEPWKRVAGALEKELLRELSGTQPLQWADVGITLCSFAEATTFEIPISCTYDMQVAATKYLTAVVRGDIPVRVFFNGTAFFASENGFLVEPLSWDCECEAMVPVQVWRDAMDACFAGQAWMRVDRATFDALARYRVSRGFDNWDRTLEYLLAAQEETIS